MVTPVMGEMGMEPTKASTREGAVECERLTMSELRRRLSNAERGEVAPSVASKAWAIDCSASRRGESTGRGEVGRRVMRVSW